MAAYRRRHGQCRPRAALARDGCLSGLGPSNSELKDVGPALPHLAFFDRLAALGDAHSPRRHVLVSGMLTLRLLDRWATRDVSGRDPTLREFVLLRQLIEGIDDHCARDVLLRLTDNVKAVTTADVGPIPVLLFSYGLLLEDLGEWAPAIDVYETAREYSRGPDDKSGLPLVYVRLGYCCRQLGLLDKAADAYREGERIATAIGDQAAVLRVRNAEGCLAMHRGNMPDAVRLLEGVVFAAQADGHRAAEAMATHDRGLAEMKMGKYVSAAASLFAALELYDEVLQQERALEDLATVLTHGRAGIRAGCAPDQPSHRRSEGDPRPRHHSPPAARE